MNDTIARTEEFSIKCQKVLGMARQLFQSGPDWVTFFREVLGVEGAARKVFTEQSDFVTFEKSSEYAEIQQMVNGLRNRKGSGGLNANEATRVITVRLPESLHEALKAEASDHNTSMNKLCIAKLLQVLAEAEKAAPQTAMHRSQTAPPAPVARPQVPATAHASAPVQAGSTGFRSTWNPSQNHQG